MLPKVLEFLVHLNYSLYPLIYTEKAVIFLCSKNCSGDAGCVPYGSCSHLQIVRPTLYLVVKEMIDKMGYVVKLVCVTKRARDAYFAQLYLAQLVNEAECQL
ncbi:hypothetical protein F0562_031368 [Nyssa sinensis]|uniref:BFN domain-containing protein n=1 Tax=Nyssa sinensis TaxID=561372 RepID=A0A5J5AY04_9ASTE|nr:hypothetical protein F0562_031368 [Nyssa sinensis]